MVEQMTKKNDKPFYKELFDGIIFVVFIAVLGFCFGFGMYLGVMYAALFYGSIL